MKRIQCFSSLSRNVNVELKPYEKIPSLTASDIAKLVYCQYSQRNIKEAFEGFYAKHGSIFKVHVPGSKYPRVYICDPQDGQTLVNADGPYPHTAGFDFFVSYRKKV